MEGSQPQAGSRRTLTLLSFPGREHGTDSARVLSHPPRRDSWRLQVSLRYNNFFLERANSPEKHKEEVCCVSEQLVSKQLSLHNNRIPSKGLTPCAFKGRGSGCEALPGNCTQLMENISTFLMILVTFCASSLAEPVPLNH